MLTYYKEESLMGFSITQSVSELKVCRSAAGWYVGRECTDNDTGEVMPYSRLSEYYDTKDEADRKLVILQIMEIVVPGDDELPF
jgi:hypothetical protein